MSAREPRKLRVGELTIEIPDESAQPIYANLVIVNHSPDDFLIDFCFAQPGLPQARCGRGWRFRPATSSVWSVRCSRTCAATKKPSGRFPIGCRRSRAAA